MTDDSKNPEGLHEGYDEWEEVPDLMSVSEEERARVLLSGREVG
jgi:hypothetical protein